MSPLEKQVRDYWKSHGGQITGAKIQEMREEYRRRKDYDYIKEIEFIEWLRHPKKV